MNASSLPDIPYNAVLMRYSEIATKGRNRKRFEDMLIDRALELCGGLADWRVVRERGRIFLACTPEGAVLGVPQCRELRERARRIMGVVSVSPVVLVAPSPDAIETAVTATFPVVYRSLCRDRDPDEPISYRTRARRSDKRFPLTSHELEVHVADLLLDRYPRLEVNLAAAELSIEVEVRRQRAFVSYHRFPGPGGLPSGTGGRVLALLSGGIDSPVACYRMIRRGCLVDFVTFHSAPYTPPELIRNVAGLAEIVNRYQPAGRLLAVNLLPAQKAIRDGCRSRYRTVLYRRFMVRLATAAARCLGAQALLTGDNLGQVASQTLENLSVISQASPMVILRPLISCDKTDTTAEADAIGTLEPSNENVPDSCTVFAPANPATITDLPRIAAEEARLDVAGLLRACASETRLVSVDDLSEKPLPGMEQAMDEVVREQGL